MCHFHAQKSLTLSLRLLNILWINKYIIKCHYPWSSIFEFYYQPFGTCTWCVVSQNMRLPAVIPLWFHYYCVHRSKCLPLCDVFQVFKELVSFHYFQSGSRKHNFFVSSFIADSEVSRAFLNCSNFYKNLANDNSIPRKHTSQFSSCQH